MEMGLRDTELVELAGHGERGRACSMHGDKECRCSGRCRREGESSLRSLWNVASKDFLCAWPSTEYRGIYEGSTRHDLCREENVCGIRKS